MRDVIDGGDQYKKTTPQVSLAGFIVFLDCLSRAEGNNFSLVKAKWRVLWAL